VRIYETAFIVNPQSDDATIDRQVAAVTDIIKNNGGEIVREDRLGTRRMAYEIEGLTQGFYASILFRAGTDVLPLLERHYKLEEPYVRYMTIRFEGDPDNVGPIGDEKFGRPDRRHRGRDDRRDRRDDRDRDRRDDRDRRGRDDKPADEAAAKKEEAEAKPEAAAPAEEPEKKEAPAKP